MRRSMISETTRCASGITSRGGEKGTVAGEERTFLNGNPRHVPRCHSLTCEERPRDAGAWLEPVNLKRSDPVEGIDRLTAQG